MKNRIKQRANRKLAKRIQGTNDMYNVSSYADKTAYVAIRNIEKENKVKK